MAGQPVNLSSIDPSTMRDPRQELWNAFFKERINSLRPRKYEASSDISVFQLFCSECRQYLDERGIAAEEDRVRQAALFLDGEAKLHYGSIEESSPPDERPRTLDDFYDILRQRFISYKSRWDALRELTHLKFSPGQPRQYIDAFRRLVLRAAHIDDDMKRFYFFNG